MTVSPEQQQRLAWMVVILLFFGSVLNYVDRAALGTLQPEVRRDLELSNEDFGKAATAFLIAYMVLYVLGGRLADWLGCRRTFLLTVVFWSLANMLHAVAQGLGSLALFRALLGLGEGGYYPTAMRGATEWFPAKQRAKAVGLFLCGLCLGITVTPPLVLWINREYGWRAAFLVTGAMGFVLVPPWLLLHRYVKRLYGTADPAPYYQPRADDPVHPSEDLSIWEVLCRRKYICLLISRGITDGAWWFYLFWIPGYFRSADGRGFDELFPSTVGLILAVPFIAADLGSLSGAWTSTALIQRGMGVNRARKLIMIPSALMGALGATAHAVQSPVLAVLLVSMALFGHLSWSSNIHTAIAEIVPKRHVAVLYGLTGATGTLMGALTQTMVGRAVDQGRYTEVFICVGSVYLISITLLLCAGRIERLKRTEPVARVAPL